jgi:putative transposase
MKYPRFKRREKYNSFTYPQYGGFRLKDNKLALSYIGAIKFKIHKIPMGTLKRCTIIRDVDQWYACITTDDNVEKAVNKVDVTKPVGIDVGLLNWLALSNGNVIQNTLNFEAQAKKVKKLQLNLARKKKGSKNRDKASIQLAKAWRRIRRCRDDFVHKTSTSLSKEGYTLVVFEKLDIANMVKNHSLPSAIMDATWAKLRQYTAYKVERRGGQVILVNPRGTSQKCSRCGVVTEKKA